MNFNLSFPRMAYLRLPFCSPYKVLWCLAKDGPTAGDAIHHGYAKYVWQMHGLQALPRVALYSLWSGGATQDVGWVRYAFDKFEVPYELIYKERVKKGNLKNDYDVIVMPT